MDNRTNLAPFYFQMLVTPTLENKLHNKIQGCLATVIIFSNSGEKARERVGRFLAIENFEIYEIKRVQLLSKNDVKNMSQPIKTVYKLAEQKGIGHLFDTW